MRYRLIYITSIALGLAFSVVWWDITSAQWGLGEMRITTTSRGALKQFEQGLEKMDNLRTDEAREHFIRAAKKDPNFALAYYYWALTASSFKELQICLNRAVKLSDNVSLGERLLILSAEANLLEDDLTRGEELLVRLGKLYPQDKRVHFTLGAFYYTQHKYEKAISELNQAIEIDPDFASVYNMLGFSYFNTGDFERAEEAIKNYVQLVPNEPNPYNSLAELYLRRGRYDDAITEYKKALKIDPKFYLSYQGIGHGFCFKGDFRQARVYYQRVFELARTPSTQIAALNWMAISYVYQGETAKAHDILNKALKIAQENTLLTSIVNLYFTMGRLYLEQGELEQAETEYRQGMRVVKTANLPAAIKNNFKQSWLWAQGYLAAKKDDFEKAFSKAEGLKLMIKQGDNPLEMGDYQALMGYIHFERGDFATAMEYLQKSNLENPFNIYKMAVAHSRIGHIEEASRFFNKVVNYNQNSLDYALVRNDAVMQVKTLEEVAGKR